MLPHYLAAPTLVSIGGVRHLADRLRLGDFALLLQEAATALGRAPDADDLPEFSDPDVSAWLAGDGLAMVFWCSLRRNWPGFSVDDAFRLVWGVIDEMGLWSRKGASDDEQSAIFSAAFRHGKHKEETGGDGVDIALLKWGRVIRHFAEEGKGLPPQVAEYTLDQADLLLARDDPEDKQDAIDQGRAWADWEAAHLRMHGAKGAAVPAEVTLESLGYAVVPGQEQEVGPARAEINGDAGEHGRWADDGGRRDE